MKNFWKLLGIIALVAVIGFGVVGCGGDDDDDGPDPGPGPGPGGSKNLSIASDFQGTWVGNEANGTLTVTSSSIQGTAMTKAYDVANTINTLIMMIETPNSGYKGSINASGKEIKATISYMGNSSTQTLYTYKVEGKTLTITDPEEEGEDAIVFTGTK
jgi:hypothetical protein